MCDVCDKTGANEVFHGYAMHGSCAPKSWAKDHKERDEFMARVRVWFANAVEWKKKWAGPKAVGG